MSNQDHKVVELEIIALSHSVTQSQNYAVVLGELEGNRRLPIVIGGYEAQAIAVVLERMTPNRPLTHDLFKNALSSFGIEVKEIVINDLLDGIFYSQLICEKEGEIIKIDSRTSDALALAVRFSCPVYTYEFIMEAAGVVLEEAEEDIKKQIIKKEKPQKAYSSYSTEELQKLLEKVLEEENYEKAAHIRDELNKRK
ncbi:MAG: bifunctional nuclease family protein [Saprospiraceae bacterium]|nr:bifunctional nuclease family protein [Saprospiraceae bacterium]MBK8449872.1 bifunctional nuclease family protein [Saprospiraceae bacterium]MBK9221473.1 bifunctional nuclease family protein [Saprospiraceae bacterium]MBK9721589.1 bifunctional nuclease family protein [Saprospiraceae bacterium]MBK9728654.1 bifunctional nuclease family protein [Saprospiraceae bacterium]